MANHKSAIKRHRQSKKRQAHNRGIKSELSTFTKKVIEAGKEDAQDLLKKLQSKIDKAARKGIMHRKKAARQLGRITKLVSQK